MRQARIILLAILMAALITATLLLVTRRNAVLISAIGFSLTPRPAIALRATVKAAFWWKLLGLLMICGYAGWSVGGCRGRLGSLIGASSQRKFCR
jgi:hypothetical protein